MKVYSKIIAIAAIPIFFACNSETKKNSDADSVSATDNAETGTPNTTSYVRLNSGTETQTIIRDTAEGGGYIYANSREPLENDLLFVDVSTGDTLYGPSGTIVNNAVIQTDGTWKLDEAKIKRDGDKVKIKSGDEKLKMDDDELKLKSGDTKMKSDEDESKTKTPSTKEKNDMEDDESKTKPRN